MLGYAHDQEQDRENRDEGDVETDDGTDEGVVADDEDQDVNERGAGARRRSPGVEPSHVHTDRRVRGVARESPAANCSSPPIRCG